MFIEPILLKYYLEQGNRRTRVGSVSVDTLTITEGVSRFMNDFATCHGLNRFTQCICKSVDDTIRYMQDNIDY